ncbi:MAG: FHA domain-containing protein [Planctomycetes bacterium]|nr:FHA domain-containing protein [Planctomycetota bacterium]
MAKLVIREGDYSHEHTLDEVETLIGRSQKCLVRLTEPAASRNHCTILRTPEGWLLMDLQSSNGTILNGARITESPLKTGDTIRIGNAELVFKDDADDSKKVVDVREKFKELENDKNVVRYDIVKTPGGEEELQFRRTERNAPRRKDLQEPETKDTEELPPPQQ